MNLFSQHSREALRRRYREAWRKHGGHLPLEPLEAQIADVLAAHPEYHSIIEAEDALERDFRPQAGHENPFLHMGLHLALHEQVATDRPAGIAEVHRRLTRALGSAHAAEHRMMEVLASALQDAQRSPAGADERLYLESLRRLRP
ncbi:MAG: DUF1841 family protein [Steroidobacterales bacterium]